MTEKASPLAPYDTLPSAAILERVPHGLVWHNQPKSLGMALPALEEGFRQLALGCLSGQHPGGQLYISRHGNPLLEFCAGECQTGKALETCSILPWFSASKPLIAMVIMGLIEEGLLALDAPVRNYLPDFAGNKETCTLRHVLTHTGGFSKALVFGDGLCDPQRMLAEIGAYPAENIPGERAAYHPVSGWFILSECARLVTGKPIQTLLQERILVPLEMKETYFGISRSQQKTLQHKLAHVARGTTQRAPYVAADDASIKRRNSPEEIAAINPGGGVRGSAKDLGRFYEWLLAKGCWENKVLLHPHTVEMSVACHRWGMPDMTLGGAPLAWGLGFGKHGNADVHQAYSRLQFNHSGMVSSVGVADPANGLVCVAITTGLIDPLTNARRLRALTGAAVLALN